MYNLSYTPLHRAGTETVDEFLLANVNARNNDLKTPLDNDFDGKVGLFRKLGFKTTKEFKD